MRSGRFGCCTGTSVWKALTTGQRVIDLKLERFLRGLAPRMKTEGGRRMSTFNFPTTRLLTAIYQAWLRQKIEKLLSRFTPTRVSFVGRFTERC